MGKAYIIDPKGNIKPTEKNKEGKEEEEKKIQSTSTPESDAGVGGKARKDYIQHDDVGHMVMAGMAEWGD